MLGLRVSSFKTGFLAMAGLLLASGVALAGHGIHYGGFGYGGIGYRPGYYGGFNRGLGYGYGAYGRGYGLYGYGRGLGYGGYGLGYGGYGLGYGYGGFGRGVGLYGLGLGTGLGLGYGLGSASYGLGGYGLGYGGYGYGGYGLGYGGYVPSYAGYTAGYGGYAAPYVGNGFASVPANPPVNPNANYAPPAQTQQPPANDNTAHLMVVVPESAELWFNGTKTSVTGTQREFVTPALTPGKNFTYEIKARWMENGRPVEQTQSVQVQANAWKMVNFTARQTPEVP